MTFYFFKIYFRKGHYWDTWHHVKSRYFGSFGTWRGSKLVSYPELFSKISFDRRYQIKVATDNSKVLFPVGTKYLAQSNRAIFSPYEYITLIRLSIDNVSPIMSLKEKRSLAATLNYLTSSYEFYQGLFSIFNSFADEKCTNENFNRHISIYNSNKNQTVKDTDEVASSSQSTMLSSPYTEGFFEQNALGLLPSTLPNALPSLANNLHVESSYPGTLHF